jgi:hypothetical protein
MKIQMTVNMAGPEFSVNAGEETERFGDDEAKRLIAAGYAIPLAEEKTERAVKKPVQEKRVK